MDIIDLTCPKCGGTMSADAALTSAKCEFCGHSVLFSEPQRQALQRRREQPKKPPTKTDAYRQKLTEEKKNAPAPQSADDEGLGRVLFRLFGLRWRLRQLLSFLLLIVTVLLTTVIANRLYTAELQTYYLVAGIAATVTGAFCLWVSYRAYRSIPLGVGLGLLITLLIRLFGA